LKRSAIAVIIAAFSICTHAQNTIRHPKIGLGFPGGGAKGFAHVCALKVIEVAGNFAFQQ